MRRWWRAWVVALLGCASLSAGAQPAAATGYVMPGTETWNIADTGGARYRVFVSRPAGPPPAEGYPVLYVLDGNAIFASFAEARRIQEESTPAIGRTMVVGIGYPTDLVYDKPRRVRDFTPPLPSPPPLSPAKVAPGAVGGRDRFQSFLLDRLMPEVARRYRVDGGRQALFGHSLAGMFALHVFYSRPGLFQVVVAASPSLWWNDQALLAEERTFAARLTAGGLSRPPARLMVLVGEHEQRLTTYGDAIAFAKRLEPLSAWGLRSRFAILDGEDHMTVPSRAVTATLRFVYTGP